MWHRRRHLERPARIDEDRLACDVYEINCAPHNFYGNLCSVISAHFSATIPNFRVMEIDIDSVAWRDEFTPPPVIENGELVLPTGPGWGVEVNEAAIRARPPKILSAGGTYDMAKYRIVTPAGASFTDGRRRLRLESEALAGMDAEIVEAPTDEAGFIAAAQDADAIYAKGMPSPRRSSTRCAELQGHRARLASAWTSVDVRRPPRAASRSPTVPDTFIEEVADHAMMLLLAALPPRCSSRTAWCARAAGRKAARSCCKIPRLMGLTLGFISFGRVARAVAKRAAPFGLRMMAYDPFVEEMVMSEHGVLPATLRRGAGAVRLRLHARARPRPEAHAHAEGEALPPDEADRASSSISAAARRWTRRR